MRERPYRRRPVKGAQVNQSLSSPPTHAKVVAVLADLTRRDANPDGQAIYGRRWNGAFSANVIADACGVEGARRGGRGAVGGSWSGTMSGSLRVSPTLRAMVRLGLLGSFYDRGGSRILYHLTESGRKLAEEGPS